MIYPTIDQIVGNTPLVRLQRIGPVDSLVLAKLEGNNPASSVKDRAALYMITEAEKAGHIQPGDTLIEATSGNTGIALAMVAAIRGYRMILIMPDNLSIERRAAMKAYGAELMLGTTGTIMGTSRYLKEQNPDVQIVGLQPSEGSQIAGIRRWPDAYLPTIYEPERVDVIMDISQEEAETMTRTLATQEGIFCGASAGGAVVGAIKVAKANPGSVVVTIICDRGDRYLSTGIYEA
jgi:cysteine synthase B